VGENNKGGDMKTKVTVTRYGRHPGDIQVVAVLELARVPTRGEYIVIKGQRYKVETVRLLDNGDARVEVER
jgi:hypothetical protein